jgi:Leucine-rich repeat (LRR) protein
MAALTELDVSKCALGPGALAELRRCTGLRTLDLSGNATLGSLSGLPTGGLQSLKAAACSLKEVGPLAGSRLLERLDVSRNQIASLEPLAGLTSLTGKAWGTRR